VPPVAPLRTLVPHFNSSFEIDFEEELVNVCLLLNPKKSGRKYHIILNLTPIFLTL
jgi:hypothetical protein